MSEESQNVTEIINWLPIAISIGALVISSISLLWNFVLESQRKKAKIQVWQRNSYYTGGSDDRTKINLVIRNLSHRPTAVIDIHVKNDDGVVTKNVGEEDKVFLPIKIEPWDVQIVSFRVEPQEVNSMSNITLRDIDDNQIVVTKSKDKTWHE